MTWGGPDGRTYPSEDAFYQAEGQRLTDAVAPVKLHELERVAESLGLHASDLLDLSATNKAAARQR